ncbi:MerR family transcriptional regulator [Micromonospora costi]|uniref:MerR family transcriptional regulator n=1 Tax=Micromonospora costi TaxID=1530042 RepID=A0A3B0A1Y5_9ACTN|nr:MerR family transcriptional regulator [Micromonospora costi]RKN54430.1 MerR family transcriptional regulator [Micromonospora costi]
MGTEHDSGRRWTVGELARATGVTVRALHHYDQLGLVSPGERTASGHRRYTAADVRRLYRVRGLRQLGLSLPEIAVVLDHGGADPAALRQLLDAQLRQVRVQIERANRLEIHLTELVAQLDAEDVPRPDQFLTTLETMSMYERYFSQDQRDRLAERRAALGTEAVDAARAEMSTLIEEAIRHQRAGTPVDDPAVRDLVGRWTGLGALLGTDGAREQASAGRLWDDHREEISRRMPWPAEDFLAAVEYLRAARGAGRAV